jgi:hypothetical protein
LAWVPVPDEVEIPRREPVDVACAPHKVRLTAGKVPLSRWRCRLTTWMDAPSDRLGASVKVDVLVREGVDGVCEGGGTRL